MSSKLTEQQLRKLVKEVEHLATERGKLLEREEVKQILTELNLPPDLLDEAILRVNQQERLQQRRTQQRRFWAGLAVVAAATIAGLLFWMQHQQAIQREVGTVRDRVTVAQDDGGSLSTVDRQQVPEVFYRVTLNQAPVGDRLSLRCDWIDPSGAVVHQNRYQTKEITTPVWNTYCRLPLGAGATPGTWKVELFVADRSLDSAQFQVR